MIRNVARDKLERGELALGVGIRVVRSIEIAKTMMTAGYDWLFIDLEHGAVSIETAGQIALAALDAGIAPIVRIPNGEFSIATRLLDNGAQGIVIPHVETAAEARTVVEKLRYPPQGHRGIMGSVPQFAYATMSAADMASLNASNIIAVMLESRNAIDNADAIAAVPGIDVLLIGANDLCLDMGMPGDFGHPQVSDAFARMIAACRAYGKWAGIGGVYDEPLMQHYVAMGVRFVLAGGDLGFLMGAARQRAKFLRGLPKPT